jgi:hypothetical protein
LWPGNGQSDPEAFVTPDFERMLREDHLQILRDYKPEDQSIEECFEEQLRYSAALQRLEQQAGTDQHLEWLRGRPDVVEQIKLRTALFSACLAEMRKDWLKPESIPGGSNTAVRMGEMRFRLTQQDYLDWLQEWPDMAALINARVTALAAISDYIQQTDPSWEESDSLNPENRWVLVQRCTGSGAIWLSSWGSPEEAAAYYGSLDYPEDWPVVELIDCESGIRLPRVTSTS